MRLFVKITSIILLALTLLMFVFGWFSVLDEKSILEGLLSRHGNALAKVVSDFSVDPLLLEDYPVLETVLKSFAQHESNVLSIEVTHHEKTVVSYSKTSTESGILFVSPIEFRNPQSGILTRIGEVYLQLSQVDNRQIILARQKEIFLKTLIAFIVVLVIMSLILRKTILMRINNLTKRIESVSTENGIYSGTHTTPETDLKGKDELDILSRRFDEMVGRVQQHNEALREEVARRTNDLQEAMETAERSNVAKSRFLAAASHDIRQPLQALSLYAGVLKIRINDPETAAVVDHITNGIQIMSDMLTTLLDVSRLDAGVIVPAVKPIVISDILDELGTEFKELARDKGLAFRICKCTLRTESDPVLLGRILRNLISNAVHYTDHGKVLIGCRRYGDVFRVQVYDTGIGISSDQLDEIFEDFHQVGNVARNRRLGLGLGLAIAKGMADLLGHRLAVTSLPGKGSCFSIELPLITAVQDTVPEECPRQPKAGQKENILIIDDEQDILDSLKALLGIYRYQTITALSAREAIQNLRALEKRPDIIIADYRLTEGKNGSDAIVEVGKACGMTIPGILLTGDTDPERIACAARSGFRLLHKPMDPAVLIAAIQEQLASARSE